MNTYLTTPCIIRETSEGTTRIPILDEMFQRREIQCTGEINRESVYSMILQLRYLQAQDPEKEITIYINSPGGTVSEGMAIKAFLARQTFKKDVYIDGLCASIATAIAFGIGAEVHIHVNLPPFQNRLDNSNNKEYNNVKL